MSEAANEDEDSQAKANARPRTQKDDGPRLSMAQRFSSKRLALMLLYLVNIWMAVIHACGYMVIEEIPGILQPANVDSELLPSMASGDFSILADALEAPQYWNKSDNAEHIVCCCIFAIVAMINLMLLIRAILRRQALYPPAEEPYPEPPELEDMVSKIKCKIAELKWHTARLKPDSRNGWLIANALTIIGFLLQLLRLMLYGGYDLSTGKEVLAQSDAVVMMQALILGADVLCPGITTLLGCLALHACLEILIDFLFCLCPLLATGNVFNVASWSLLRNDKTLGFNAFVSVISIIKVAGVLGKRDKEAIYRTSATHHSQQNRTTAWVAAPDTVDWWSALPTQRKQSMAFQRIVLNPHLNSPLGAAFAIGNMALRATVSVILVALVAVAVQKECPAITSEEHWHCIYLTHPLLGTHGCNCRALFSYQPRGSCTLDKFKTISQQATTLEYLLVVGHDTCSFSSEFDILPKDFFRYLKSLGLFLHPQLKMLPSQLQSASGLEGLMVAPSGIEDLPSWLFQFEKLHWVSFSASPVCSSPQVSEYFDKLDEWHCLKIFVQAMSDDASDSTNRTSKEYCTADDVANVLPYLSLFEHCMDSRSHHTDCIGLCEFVLDYMRQFDVEEPKGALDLVEARPVVGILVPELSNMTLPFMRCYMSLTECQPFGLTSEKNTLEFVWFSSLLRVATKGESDCSSCEGVIPFPP